MSGDDSFIARWSRLKRSAARSKEPQAEAKAGDRSASGGAHPAPRLPDEVQGKPAKAEPPFDPASLPPIESIVAGSDIRAFLQKGVPTALTKAALRRAWTADPAIRDFVEVAENQWDFTDPTAIPGFGPLQPNDSLRQLVGQAMGKLQEPAEAAGPPAEGRDAEATITGADASVGEDAGSELRSQDTAPPEGQCNQDTADVAALQHPGPAPAARSVPRRRSHGGAVPR